MESTASPALHSKNTQIIYSSETSTRLPPHYHSHIVRPTPSRRPFSLYVVAYGKEISLGKYIPSFPPLLSSLSLSSPLLFAFLGSPSEVSGGGEEKIDKRAKKHRRESRRRHGGANANAL